MAQIHAFIKADYLDKAGQAPLLIEYSHLKKRWRINTEIKVDPGTFSCYYDEDTELYKLTPIKELKRAQKADLVHYNSTLQILQLRLFRIVGDLKLRSLSLSPGAAGRDAYGRGQARLAQRRAGHQGPRR